MLNFLENHDEVRFASRFYAGDAQKVLPSLVVSAMINTGPFMLYGGQELGEDAIGSPGFSGDDGRTSIFDYTVMPKVQHWLNGGKCDGVLSSAEKQLRDRYARVLTLCNREPAISGGSFFDLMYVNYCNPAFNPHRHFSFMRSCPDSTLVIAVNFSSSPAEMKINIPQHAFDAMGILPGRYRAVELLSGTRQSKELTPDLPFVANVDSYGAVIWKIKPATKAKCSAGE